VIVHPHLWHKNSNPRKDLKTRIKGRFQFRGLGVLVSLSRKKKSEPEGTQKEFPGGRGAGGKKCVGQHSKGVKFRRGGVRASEKFGTLDLKASSQLWRKENTG